MIKKIIILPFLLSYFLSIGSYSTLYIGFLLNQNYFAEELCIEKEIERSCCKGSCQVKKQFKEEADQKAGKLPTILIDKKNEMFADAKLVCEQKFFHTSEYSDVIINFIHNLNILPDTPPPRFIS